VAHNDGGVVSEVGGPPTQHSDNEPVSMMPTNGFNLTRLPVSSLVVALVTTPDYISAAKGVQWIVELYCWVL
jgi:hypothetical protein